MKQLYICVLFIFAINLPVQAEEPAGENENTARAAERFEFPPWPEAAATGMPDSDFVPPPPGPYMSNALSAIGNGFDDGVAAEAAPSDSVFFKPDMAWPERRFSPPPERWVPKNGYHYAPTEAVKQTPLARHHARPYGYSRAPQYMQPPYGWGPAQPWSDGRYAQPPASGY